MQSYLELISLYKDLLARKREELRLSKERLENGVTKIAQASAQVADLQINLKQEQIIVEEKKAKTGALIETIGQEKTVVDEAVEAGREDEEAAAKLQVNTLAGHRRFGSLEQSVLVTFDVLPVDARWFVACAAPEVSMHAWQAWLEAGFPLSAESSHQVSVMAQQQSNALANTSSLHCHTVVQISVF